MLTLIFHWEHRCSEVLLLQAPEWQPGAWALPGAGRPASLCVLGCGNSCLILAFMRCVFPEKPRVAWGVGWDVGSYLWCTNPFLSSPPLKIVLATGRGQNARCLKETGRVKSCDSASFRFDHTLLSCSFLDCWGFFICFWFIVSSSVEAINFNVQNLKCHQIYGDFWEHCSGLQINVLA